MAEVVVRTPEGKYRIYSTTVKNFISHPLGREAMQGWLLYKTLSRYLGIDLPAILAALDQAETSRPDLYASHEAVLGEITSPLPDDPAAQARAEAFYGSEFLIHMEPWFQRMADYWNALVPSQGVETTSEGG